MKRFLLLPLVATLSIFVSSCDKPQTEAERNAEIERQVQLRLDAEHQADEQQKLAQSQAELDAREQALAAKENRPGPTAAPVATQPASTHTTAASNSDNGSYSTFYRKLEPYGDWMETSAYGYVFQPRQAQSRDWRPYTNGHWVYTDAGWTWISEEQFGWATYHYGRWVRLRSTGWVWVPGEQWAPAWVSWRKGNDYVGWAPLPPEARFDRQTGIRNWADNYYDIGPEQYAFVPVKEFGAKVSLRVVVPTERNVTIINQTTNITNITYDNSVIVDRGPSYEDLRARSSQPIERFRLERTQDFNNERPVFRGEVVALPTLDFRPAERSARPARVVRTISQPIVEHGWSGIEDAQAAQKARAKMKSEATPPPNLPPKRFVRPEATVIPPSSAPVNVGKPGARVTPVPSASPAVAPLVAEPIQPSPAENIFSPKQADRNRRETEKTAREEKQKQHLQEQDQRRAERQQKLQQRRRDKPNETPAATATPPPAATATPSLTPPAATTPVPTGTQTPNAPSAPDRSERGRMQQGERRAQRQQRMEQQRGRQPNETSTPVATATATPSPVATAAPRATPPVVATPASETTPDASPARDRSQGRRRQQEERRAQRQQRMEERRGKNSREPAATPTEIQTPAPAITPSATPSATPTDSAEAAGDRTRPQRTR